MPLRTLRVQIGRRYNLQRRNSTQTAGTRVPRQSVGTSVTKRLCSTFMDHCPTRCVAGQSSSSQERPSRHLRIQSMETKIPVLFFAVMVTIGGISFAEERRQSFDQDPQWDGHNNR